MYRLAAGGKLTIETDAEGYSRARAAQPIAAGAVIARFGAREVLAQPNYLTVQTGPDRHILLDPIDLQYINHSCDPNVFFDTDRGELVALRDLAAGEEVRFFYPSTEWHMDRSFNCHCGASACLGTIAGADRIAPEVLARYRLADHIAALIAARAAQVPA